MTELKTMPNIGIELARKFTSVRIGDAETLLAVGAIEAYARLKDAYPQVCTVHLYALEGAVRNVAMQDLPQEIRGRLQAAAQGLK